MTDSVMGHCYTLIGRAAHGFGMINAVRSECIRVGDSFQGAINALTMAISLIDIQRFSEAKEFIDIAAQEGRKWPNSPLMMIVNLLKAYVYYRDSNQKQSAKFIKRFLLLREKIEVSMWPYPYLLEICWANKTENFPKVKGLSLNNEIRLSEKNGNIFMMGIALRFKAMLKNHEKLPKNKVLSLLTLSEESLRNSGHLTEYLRTRLVRFNLHIENGDNKKAHNIAQSIANKLTRLPLAMIPPDLLPFRDENPDMRNLSEIMAEAGDKMIKIIDPNQLVQHIVNISNKLFGAERGAIFIVKNKLVSIRHHNYLV